MFRHHGGKLACLFLALGLVGIAWGELPSPGRAEFSLGLDPSVNTNNPERLAGGDEIVSRDEREGGLRMLLNLGHTLGHAVEKLSRYRGILHGEAVAIGLVYAGHRSEELGLAEPGTARRLELLLQRFGLPTELPEFSRKAYLDALRVDKKSRNARIRYIVLRRIGQTEAVDLTPAEILPTTRSGASGKGSRGKKGRSRGGKGTGRR